MSGEPTITAAEALARGEEGPPGVDDDELRAALQEVTACAQPDPDAYSLPDRIEPGQTLVSPQGETLRVSRGGSHVYGVWTGPPVSFDAHYDVAALRAAGWTLREFAPIDTEEAGGRAKDAARLALDGADPVTRRALLGDLCIEAGGDPYAVRRALGAPIPREILGELVAVPLRAFHAALDVLGDLLDTELEHEVCPLCMAAAGCSHVTGCPVGCADTVRNALDYGDPIRQRAALVRLGALRGDEEASAPRAPVSPEPDGALRIHDVESFVQALGDAIEEGALPNVLGLDDLRQLSSEGVRVVSLCFTDDSPPVQIALSLRAASPSLPGEHVSPQRIGEMDRVPGLVAADGRVLLPASLGLKPGDAVRFERVGDGFRLALGAVVPAELAALPELGDVVPEGGVGALPREMVARLGRDRHALACAALAVYRAWAGNGPINVPVSELGGALREAGIDPIQGGDTGSGAATVSLVSADLLGRLLALHRLSLDGAELVEITAGNAAGTGVRLSFEPRSPSAARWRPPGGVEGGEVLTEVLDELDRRTNAAADRGRSKAEWLAALQTELCAAGAGERAEATDVALVRLAAVALLALRTRAKTREASDG